jgi:hypothetical protein
VGTFVSVRVSVPIDPAFELELIFFPLLVSVKVFPSGRIEV